MEQVNNSLLLVRWLILSWYYFSSGISNALRIKGCANIYNVFWICATLLKHFQRVLNIRNAFETLATCVLHIATRLKHHQRVFWISATRLKHLQRVLNISNVFCFKRVANIQNTLQMFQTRSLLIFKTRRQFWWKGCYPPYPQTIVFFSFPFFKFVNSLMLAIFFSFSLTRGIWK